MGDERPPLEVARAETQTAEIARVLAEKMAKKSNQLWFQQLANFFVSSERGNYEIFWQVVQETDFRNPSSTPRHRRFLNELDERRRHFVSNTTGQAPLAPSAAKRGVQP